MRIHLLARLLPAGVALLAALFTARNAAAVPMVCDESCRVTCDICGNCDPETQSCSVKCEDCWKQCDQECPYWESTPLCNYLDRGLNDHEAKTADRYSVTQAKVKTLHDIDRLLFGLDLPGTNCVDVAHDLPCADRSLTTEWMIDSVRLSVGGVPLFFEEKGINDAVLMIARGGAARSGMVGWDHMELRQNPSWGLSEKEIPKWLERIPLTSAGITTDMVVPALSKDVRTVTGDELSRLIEGVIGRRLAELNKSGDCNKSGKVFCDSAPIPIPDFPDVLNVFWRGAETSEGADCDMGSCPPLASRTPSPWFEIQGDPAAGTVTLNADLDVVLSNKDHFDCEYGAPCAAGVSKGHEYANLAQISVVAELGVACVEDAGMFNPRLTLDKIEIKSDGGIGGDIVALVSKVIDLPFLEELSDGLEQGVPFAYPACDSVSDVVTVGSNGSLTFAPIPAPPSTAWVPSQKVVRYARWLTATPAVPHASALQLAHGTHVAKLAWTTPLNAGVPTVISGPIDPNQKQNFTALRDAIVRTAALQANCPAIDFGKLEMPIPDVNATEAVLCTANGFGPVNAARCVDLGKLKSFVMQPEILACLLAKAQVPTDLSVPIIYAELMAGIEATLDTMPSLETFIPVPSIELDVRTGKAGATDGFAFVDFSDPAEVSAATRAKEACKNRYEESLKPNPFTYPDCFDPTDPDNNGLRGCPCADIPDISSFDGGFPDGAGSHLKRRNQGGQYCDDGDATILNNSVVCGNVVKGGLGNPVCMECGIGTNVGCPCELDSECQGIEDGLRCSGGEESGWFGDGGGTCLPAPVGVAGREALEELFWFCLDNCHDLGLAQGWAEPGCIYRDGGYDVSHGVCVDITGNACGFPGFCEEQNLVCGANGECTTECVVHTDCPTLGFPADYACDSGGHCVPPECAGNGVDISYCMLYR